MSPGLKGKREGAWYLLLMWVCHLGPYLEVPGLLSSVPSYERLKECHLGADTRSQPDETRRWLRKPPPRWITIYGSAKSGRWLAMAAVSQLRLK
jgi:hypothetical protein